MNSSVIFLNRDPLCGLTRDAFLKKLKISLKGRVSACYLFGSFAANTMSRDSDIDIILIQDSNVPFLDRQKEFLDLYEIGPRLDLLIYTPAEFQKLMAENAGFWKSVKDHLMQLTF